MSKFISELSNQKTSLSDEDYLIVDNPTDGKTYKISGSVFVPIKENFQNISELVVEHQLGRKPSVVVVDLAGDLIEGTVVYLDDNSLQLNFTKNISGEITVW